MKKIFYVFVFFTSLSFSQGINLELNQVLLLDVSSETYTVPEGKVWKITSAMISCHSNCSSSVWINGSSVYFHSFTSYMPGTGSQANAAGKMTQLPIWLPEGTVVGSGSGVDQLSVLEFNAE